MLYVTTRNNRDPFTAYRAMREGRGPDGGFFLPFRHPMFSSEEINALAEKTFGQCVAEVLNRLFNMRDGISTSAAEEHRCAWLRCLTEFLLRKAGTTR